MIIESSGVSLFSDSSLVKAHESTESVRAWVGKGPVADIGGLELGSDRPASNLVDSINGALSSVNGPRVLDRVEITAEALALLAGLPKALGSEGGKEENVEPDPIGNLYTYKLLIEAMTGRKIKIMDLPKANAEDAEVEGTEIHKADEAQDPDAERVGWGVEYHYREIVSEEQHLLFRAGGTVMTADGVERGFDIKLRMSRSHYSETTVDFAAGDGVLVDPLVVNFGSGGTTLSTDKRLFDLDSDGIEEAVSLPSAGSGLLVYDKNRDGVANNGAELFGPTSGNGFTELAAHDADENYWIDESDPVYNLLRVAVEGPDGEDRLLSLKEVGIGAIYLKYTDTAFSIKDAENTLLGEVRRTSVYLSEDSLGEYSGGGTVQQVDLVI
ncbi:MAG: hypothetical protein IME99_05785 [Proteobacteria bacterium]|nr:hypothetical protein [Pseudomonadota bacterium]